MKKTLKTILSMALAVAMFAAYMPAMSLIAFADDEAEPAVTSWVDLYTGMGLSNVEAGAGKYDAVTTATKIVTNHHYSHIPAVVHKDVVSTDESGNPSEVALDGVMLSGKEVSVTPAVKNAYWETCRTKGENKQYGTDEFVVIPDDTVDGYAWDDYLANIYAVTISDGTTVVGALPWVDFYGEKANGNTASPHYNKVEIALNNSTTGVPVSGERHGEVIYRFDPFYTDEVLNAGTYTVTVYAEGFEPLTAYIEVPVYTFAKAAVSDAKSTSANVAFEGLPEDYDVICTVDGNVATLDGTKLSYEAVLPGNHTLKVSDESGKYNDFSASFVVMADAAVAVFDGTKLVKAKEASDELFAAYIAGITSVTINDKTYNATGRGSKKVIQSDGSLDLSKTDFPDPEVVLNFTVKSPGYDDLTFSYVSEKARAEAKITKVTPSSKTYKVKTLKKKAKSFNLRATVSSGAKATFAKANKAGGSKIKVSKTGKVTLKKGLKKGTYKIKVKVSAPATYTHKAVTKTVTIKVKVKK